MQSSLFSSLIFTFAAGLILACNSHAQDSDGARKKCVEFGFKDKTPSHDTCMKQFLQATGSGKVPAKPGAPTPPISSAQLEQKFWDSTIAVGNKEAFEAYLQSHPKGQYIGMAKANLARLNEVANEQQKMLAAAAETLAAAKSAAVKAALSVRSYGTSIVARIRPNITFLGYISTIAGNTGAAVEVRTATDGTIISRKLISSSGVEAWDEAVLKAVDKTGSLPLDVDGSVPPVLLINFRPQDQPADGAVKKDLALAKEAPKQAEEGAAAGAGVPDGGIQCAVAQVETTIKPAGPDFRLQSRMLIFDYDSSAIKPEFQAVVEAHARWLRADKTRRVALVGHTDARGGREYNLATGQERAEAVRRAMGLLGVPDSQMEPVSFGKEKPADQGRGADEASCAKNRRVELTYR
jgi:peptidoglycan-associated lipoprotein